VASTITSIAINISAVIAHRISTGETTITLTTPVEFG